MASVPDLVEEQEFLVQPVAVPGVGAVSSEAGFCDGCSGCKTKTVESSRIIAGAPAGEEEFVVQPLSLAPNGFDAPDSWCSGCRGCSGSCRSISK